MINDDITVITSKRRLLSLNLKELWKYRDLVFLFVKRDLKSSYKQTILGPLWLVINPFISSFVFTLIFGIIANISTDGIPQFVFYMSGNILWGLFSSCLTRCSSTFLSNARLFGKVYFPRLAAPLAEIFYNYITFFVRFFMFLIIIIIYMLCGANIKITFAALILPFLVLHISFLGAGVGLIISSVTVKYRDLGVLVSFGTTLWMYLTPIVYPVSQIPENLRRIMLLNPTAPIVEAFRYGFLGTGCFSPLYLFVSIAVTAAILFIGLIMFNQTEKNFIDTV